MITSKTVKVIAKAFKASVKDEGIFTAESAEGKGYMVSDGRAMVMVETEEDVKAVFSGLGLQYEGTNRAYSVLGGRPSVVRREIKVDQVLRTMGQDQPEITQTPLVWEGLGRLYFTGDGTPCLCNPDYFALFNLIPATIRSEGPGKILHCKSAGFIVGVMPIRITSDDREMLDTWGKLLQRNKEAA